jgi:hypothetical protein
MEGMPFWFGPSNDSGEQAVRRVKVIVKSEQYATAFHHFDVLYIVFIIFNFQCSIFNVQ